MKEFIEFTEADGAKILVRRDSITDIKEMRATEDEPQATLVGLNDSNRIRAFTTYETYEEVVEKIKEAYAE